MQPISNIAYTYDGIIAIALALNKSLPGLQRLDPPRSLEEFSYSDSEMAEVILRSADDIDFIGLVVRAKPHWIKQIYSTYCTHLSSACSFMDIKGNNNNSEV